MVTNQGGQSEIVNSLYKAPINNAVLDPMQGFDADVWVLDQATGSYIMVGRFVSIQVSIRNSTEPYMEFNQRIPRYLDGEFQIGWVLERGMIDYRILQQTFGYSTISRIARVNRGVRFQISFSLNAPELNDNMPINMPTTTGTFGTGVTTASNRRKTVGKLRLTFCKVDSLTIGATSGRSVIANRWEGMAEGIEEVNSNVAGAGAYLDEVVGATAYANSTTADNAIKAFPWDLDGLTIGDSGNVIAPGNNGGDFFTTTNNTTQP
jgi:hypothetical protein